MFAFVLDSFGRAHDGTSLPWWGLTLAFAAAEIWVVHLHFRSQTGTFSLYEIPLVLGLVFATPQELWVAIVLGSGFALAAVRRQPLVKVCFNVANLSLHVAVAAWIFNRFVAGDASGPGHVAHPGAVHTRRRVSFRSPCWSRSSP